MNVIDIIKKWKKNSENSSLLSQRVTYVSYSEGDGDTETGGIQAQRWRFFFILGVVLIIFKGSEDMAEVTLDQYIYSWCKNQALGSGDILGANRTLSDNIMGATVKSVDENIVATNVTVVNGLADANLTSVNDCGKEETKSQKLASKWKLYLDLLRALLVYFSVTIFGTLSDHYGRKVFLCVAIAGFGIRCVIIAFVIYCDCHIAWILFGSAVDGICGSNPGVALLSCAATADRTHKTHERVFGMAIIKTMLSIGKMSTQFATGYFIRDYDFLYPMITAAVGTFIALLIASCILEETVEICISDTRYIPALPCFKKLFHDYIGFYFTNGSKIERKTFLVCLTALFFVEFGIQGTASPITFYQLGQPFCWTPEMIGWYKATYVAVTMVAGCFVLKIFQQCFSDPVIACWGTISGICFMVITGLLKSTIWFFIAACVGIGSVLPKSILRGIASSRASADLQGALFAGLISTELICAVISVPTTLTIYSSTVSTMRGLVFLVLAGVYSLAFVLILYLTRLMKHHPEEHSISFDNQSESKKEKYPEVATNK